MACQIDQFHQGLAIDGLLCMKTAITAVFEDQFSDGHLRSFYQVRNNGKGSIDQPLIVNRQIIPPNQRG